MNTFSDFGIDVPRNSGGEVATTCPNCSRGRRKSSAKCLSVNVDKGKWHCNHCEWAGGLDTRTKPWSTPTWRKPKTYKKPDPRPSIALPQNALDWFHDRGITDEVLLRNRVDYGSAFFPQLKGNAESLIFPYFRNGELVNRKYRTIAGKNFRLEKDCELVVFGLDDIDPEKPLIWVEGEPDKLALEVAGYRNVVSVPNGAPAVETKDYSSRFAFLDADRERLEAVKLNVLAVDSDPPGRVLEAELSRRLGREKCSRVLWPETTKDANDVLVRYGADELRDLIEHAEPFPIEGAFSFDDRAADVVELYERGTKKGVSTGWREVDRLYTVRPGELTVVTGIPSSGKSNVVDALLVNLARDHGWNFAVFSPENLPLEEHMATVAEKYIGKPFHAGPTPRMTREELDEAITWGAEHFAFISPPSEDDWTIERILELGAQLCLRRGIRGLVVDPWNELEPNRPDGMSETEYVSHALKRVRVFARSRGVHVWIVVHPAKLRRDDSGKYPVPTLYDCSGSANWRNKADNGLVVWRDLSGDDQAEVYVHVQKIRHRAVGRRGVAKLYYERVCATYRDAPEPAPQEAPRERYV